MFADLELHGAGGQLGLEDQLVGEGAVGAVDGVLLVVVDPRLHDPLVTEGAEAARLVEQLADVVVGAVRPQLQVWNVTINRSFLLLQFHNVL